MIRLLQQPSPAGLNLKISIKESNRYIPITDDKGLKELESKILLSEFCAIDIESDNKNPHHATLFGISFSAKKGDAFFVPLLENDLKDIRLPGVRSTLDKIFQSPIQFIGHNIKYDYLLLQKNGFKIKNIYFDTMLAAYDCYGDWDFFNLGYISQKLLGKKHKSYKEIVGKDKTFLELPFKEIVNHACEDADITMRIYPILYEELKSKRLVETYFNDTIPLIRKLGDLEFKGVRVNRDNLNKIRNSLLNQALDIKGKVYENVGRSFDLDSPKELAIILKENLELKLFVGSRRITLSLLEQLAVSNEVLQLIVKFKRYRIQIKSIESIRKCVKNNKIYPIFSQIKSPCGYLSSKNPNLFDIEGLYHLRYCFSYDMIQYFKDPKKSLNSLQKMTNDYNLQIDLSQNENEFLKTHSLASKLNSDELLLAIIIGDSDFKLSQKFMIDRLTVSTIRHDIETRYYSLFQWIEDFKRQTAKFGYAKINHKRKYFNGLASASIEKRKKAINNSIRWLIKY